MAIPVSLDLAADVPVLSGNHEDLLRLIGYLHLEHGSPEKAVVVFDALLALLPDDMQLRYSLISALLRTENAEAAMQIIEAGSGTDRSGDMGSQPPPLFHLLRSQALVQLGRLPEAARSMRIFIRQRRVEQVARS